MIKKLAKRAVLGFSLVEVLIGIFVASVGVIGILELQKHFIKSGNEVNARTIAIQLVREQFAILKNVDAFTTITDGEDAGPINKSNYSFTRSWTVEDRYFDESDTTWKAVPVDEKIDRKNIEVTVTWTDINGKAQSETHIEVFSTVSLHDSGLSASSIGEKSTPKVPYNVISTVENPPITLVDEAMTYEGVTNTKETSKPIPTVYAKGNNNLIKFETVVYDPNSDTQTLEDFATVNCSCEFSSTGSGKTPTTMRIADDGNSLVNDENSGQTVSKVIGAVDGTSQPSLCTKCCADHHDDTGVTAKYVGGSTGNHPHYNVPVTSSSVAVTSGPYVEACRFRRVDGFYELVPDWHMVDLIIMPESFFYVTDNVNAYTSYVKDVVKYCVNNLSACLNNTLDGTAGWPTRPANRDIVDTVPGTQQLIARGIYVDTASLSSENLSTVLGYVSSKANWLEYVPFYELNMSLFGDWSSDDASIVSVTNEDINTIVDPVNNYYGTYSRGRITALSVNGNTDISIQTNLDNTGITGSGQIASNTPEKIDNINVSVKLAASGNNSILIEINCQKYNNKGILGKCLSKDTEGVVAITLPNTISCTYNAQQGSQTAFLTCNNIIDWKGSISLSKSGYSFDVSTLNYDIAGGNTITNSVIMTELQ